MSDRVVIGLGNPDRGDDGVGRAVARLLRTRLPREVQVIEQDGEAVSLVLELQRAQQAWLIDAAHSGAPPGTIRRIDCAQEDVPLPSGVTSSHGFGVAEAIALARTLGALPPRCVVFAVEAAEFEHGADMSAPVAAAVETVSARILKDITEHA